MFPVISALLCWSYYLDRKFILNMTDRSILSSVMSMMMFGMSAFIWDVSERYFMSLALSLYGHMISIVSPVRHFQPIGHMFINNPFHKKEILKDTTIFLTDFFEKMFFKQYPHDVLRAHAVEKSFAEIVAFIEQSENFQQSSSDDQEDLSLKSEHDIVVSRLACRK
jgi:hypothetical protein